MVKLKFKKRRNYQRQENPEKNYKQMTQHHVDVLENIEHSILATYRNCEALDDGVVASALKSAIDGSEPDGSLAVMVRDDLALVRQTRFDVAEDIWNKGLRVVLWSVHNHSDTQPGDKEYLYFIRTFVV